MWIGMIDENHTTLIYKMPIIFKLSYVDTIIEVLITRTKISDEFIANMGERYLYEIILKTSYNDYGDSGNRMGEEWSKWENYINKYEHEMYEVFAIFTDDKDKYKPIHKQLLEHRDVLAIQKANSKVQNFISKFKLEIA
jgi:hypothetical protein